MGGQGWFFLRKIANVANVANVIDGIIDGYKGVPQFPDRRFWGCTERFRRIVLEKDTLRIDTSNEKADAVCFSFNRRFTTGKRFPLSIKLVGRTAANDLPNFRLAVRTLDQ